LNDVLPPCRYINRIASRAQSAAYVDARRQRDRCSIVVSPPAAIVFHNSAISASAKILLRDVINATVGFAQLGSRIDVPEKSLMRMFGPTGNPRAENLIAVVAALKVECRLSVTVHAEARRRRTARAPKPVTA
jgi:DNA-binding phage protein